MSFTFYDWKRPIPRGWHNVYLREGHLQPIHDALRAFAQPAVAGNMACKMPSDEFFLWADENGYDFVITTCFQDACSVYFKDELAAVQAKLTFSS